MALPLNEAQQPYSAMKRQYKRKLPQMFNENLHNGFDQNLTFGSFTKQHGGHQSISAADMVYAITAVLESDEQINAGAPNNPHNQHTLFDDNIWKANFFYAYDALAKDKQYLLRQAIALAKQTQKDIVNMGIRLMEQRAIKTHGIMRWCQIQNVNKFQSPILLCKLALFIMDAFSTNALSKRATPDTENKRKQNRRKETNDGWI
eukprot:728832_1